MSDKTYPISKIHGPAFQDDGPLVGSQTSFITFAGCDFDCSWCDAKHAVDPKYFGWELYKMTAQEILEKVLLLGGPEDDFYTCSAPWITLTGGNPALFVDDDLFDALGKGGAFIAMETQGSKFDEWVMHPNLTMMVVSPKPPSSGMQSEFAYLPIRSAIKMRSTFKLASSIKYVVFDDNDLEWIKYATQSINLVDIPFFLSVGTELNNTSSRDDILDRMAWLQDRVVRDPDLAFYRILPQLHALQKGS